MSTVLEGIAVIKDVDPLCAIGGPFGRKIQPKPAL